MKQILHFTAEWCNPCKKIKPIIEKYTQEHSDINYIQIDVDEKFDVAQEYGVMSIPTLVIIEDQKEKNRHTGIMSYEELDKLVNN